MAPNLITIFQGSAELPKALVDEYGPLTVVWVHPLVQKIKVFDLESDITLFEIKDECSIAELLHQFGEQGIVPLSAQIRFQLFADAELLKMLFSKWGALRTSPHEKSMTFLGTKFVDEKGAHRVLSEEHDLVQFETMLFSIEERLHKGDVVPIFNPESERILRQIG